MSGLAVFVPQLGRVTETFIRRHVEDLLPQHTVVVAQHGAASDARDGGTAVPTLALDRWRRRPDVRLVRRLRLRADGGIDDAAVERFLRSWRVDMVLGEYLDEFVSFVPLLRRMGIPFVVQGHGIDVSAALRRPGTAERYRQYGIARAVLTRCEAHRQRLIALGLPPHGVHVNPGGVDVPPAPIARPAAASTRLLAIGRMVPKKGPIYLLEAFRIAAGRDPAITLDVVGGGPLLPAARQFVDAAGLGARVRLHGQASSEVKNRLVAQCGVFVQHSLTDPETGDEEGLPAAIQEAMASGMAVISTNHAGIPEAVEHDVTGWLVEERQVDEMAGAMLRAAADPVRVAAAGREGHARALARYSWAHERARLLSHLTGDHAYRTAADA